MSRFQSFFVGIYVLIFTTFGYSYIQFKDTGQNLGDDYSLDVEMGDIDGDGDLDALVGNSNSISGTQTVRTWINNGSGLFTVAEQTLIGYGVALGDVDGDRDLDVLVLNGDVTQANQLWINDGTGHFTNTGQALGLGQSTDVALGDLDDDGDLDAFISRHTVPGTGQEPGHLVWFNNGRGLFTDSGQILGDAWSNSVDLGDIDGDGDLDALITNNPYGNHPSRVWLNDGRGFYSLGNQILTSDFSMDLAVGDLNGDNHLDVFVAHSGSLRENSILLNDGTGQFIDSRQAIGSLDTRSICLGDLNQDGYLDAYFANYDGWTSNGPNSGSDEIWINDGTGHTGTLITLGNTKSMDAQLGDLDGDGDLDIFVANRGANRVWLNMTCIPDPNGPIENMRTDQRFGSINCAISYADDGDSIVIGPGLYRESIVLNDKDLTLRSVDPNDPYYIGGTIIQGDTNEPVITLANNTVACEIAGLTLRTGAVGISGITTNATIRNCRIMDNVNNGMELSQESNPHLLNCLITANGRTGITMTDGTSGRKVLFCEPIIEDCIIVDNNEESIVNGLPFPINCIIDDFDL